MEEQTTPPKKATRTRKTVSSQAIPVQQDSQTVNSVLTPKLKMTENFDELVAKIIQSKQEFDNLQKDIAQIKQDWIREQKQHEVDIAQQRAQEETDRKRDQETYQYNTNLARKRAEDEFQDKKLAWEKDLAQRKEDLEAQKRELEQLRKLAADFDSQKESAIKEAEGLFSKKLTDQYDQERKLREQEVKAEKEVLGLKIANLETDNSRLNKEMEIFKRSLDEATRQVKEIAVKVIESGSNQSKNQPASES